jgi:hypothetical protein
MQMNLVPAILYRTEDAQDDNGNERQSRPKRIKVVEDTGVMFNDYDWKCHQFLAHLRRVHPANPPVMIALEGFEDKQLVKAADPLAKPGIPLYYFHSKTKLYNDIFFHFWDCVMAPAFAIVCPWFTVDSQESLDTLFALEFEK